MTHNNYLCCQAISSKQPKIQFSVSKRGGQLLWLDGLKYFRNNENRTNLFWRCHWYYRRIRCPVLICMNKYDSSDFRQIHKHRHVKLSKKQQAMEVDTLELPNELPTPLPVINSKCDAALPVDTEQEMFTI
ncbi:unnamed protein product [Ceratitis capitata]|uniref:(Mediterranean fruit fly) hypothetical protein n=1 Tax=Ceratitis capitata TaxID=7213 RepID=W8B1M8_CERCA|nr:unnamed protein product [Ceratitis capitata]